MYIKKEEEVHKKLLTGDIYVRICGYLRDLIWRNKYMSRESNDRIYKSTVRHVPTYAAEIRAQTTKTKSILKMWK